MGDRKQPTPRPVNQVKPAPPPAPPSMVVVKTVTEHTHEICTLCGGRGTEYSAGQTTSTMATCRSCQGSGQKLTKTITRNEQVDIEPIVAAVRDRLAPSEAGK